MCVGPLVGIKSSRMIEGADGMHRQSWWTIANILEAAGLKSRIVYLSYRYLVFISAASVGFHAAIYNARSIGVRESVYNRMNDISELKQRQWTWVGKGAIHYIYVHWLRAESESVNERKVAW